MNKQVIVKLIALASMLASQAVFIASPSQALLAVASNPVSSGSSSTCVVRAADDIYCVGSNTFGQLGNGNQVSTSDPQRVVGISNVSAVSVGSTSACAITHTGALYCWGENTQGQLGLGDTQNRNTATLLQGLTNVSQVAVGDNFACALTSNSALYCWGANDRGQLTTDSAQYVTNPTVIAQSPAGVTQFSISGKGICVLAADIYCWGDFPTAVVPYETRNRAPVKLVGSAGAKSIELGGDFGCFTLASNVSCWGANDHGQLGNGTRLSSSTPVAVTGISTVKDLTTGDNFSCVIDSSNDTYCWGENQDGQLIVSSRSDQLTRVPTGASKAANIEAGVNNLCLLKVDASITCYGDSSAGQSGYLLSSKVPLTNANISSGVSISSGLNTTCLIIASGALQCWGDLVPVVASSLTFTSVSVGDSSACAVSSSKKIYCWGSNTAGQLGNNTTRTSLEISEISTIGTNFSKVAVGYRHACAVTQDGLSFCWGDNSRQQLGFVGADSRIPKAVPGIGTATAVSSGDYHSCVIQTAGSVTCWGDNSKRQINATNVNLLTPTQLVLDASIGALALGPATTCLLDINRGLRCIGDNSKKAAPGSVSGSYLSVAVGGNTVCAINTEENVFCFGSADSFKLGELLVDNATPTKMFDDLQSAVSVGSKHACVISKSGKLSCWGSNASGQLTSSFGFPNAYAPPTVTISGPKAVGESLRVVITGVETKVSYTYVWKRASTVGGLVASLTTQTASSYALTGTDLSKYFGVEVKQSKWGTTSISYSSQLTSAIGAPIRLLYTPVPAISGTAKAGRILTARPGRWDAGVKLSYQWYRGKTLIRGATKVTFALTTVDVGKQLYVAVTGSKSGVPKVVTKSAKTVKIVR